MAVINAVILGIIEGLTEFLPISSTGHLILVEKILPLGGSLEFRDTFLITIQLPAILAVALYFWKRLWPIQQDKTVSETCRLWFKIIMAFVPAAILGFLLDDVIESWFFGPASVAIALVVGGIIIVGIEKKQLTPRIDTTESIGIKTALGIGLFQCLAMIPGTSRSAATIIGAMVLGANRQTAAEFSFFLAIPTMVGATVFKVFKTGLHLKQQEWILITIGGITAFLTAYIVVVAFMNYIRRHDFSLFGYYRILLGAIILLLAFL